MKLKFVLLLLSFSLTLFAQRNDYSVLLLDNEMKKNANAVIRDYQVQVDVATIDKMKFTEHKVITILNESGNRKVRSHVFYDDGTSVQKLEMYVYDGFGKEIAHFKKRDFKDVSQADGFSLYNDDRMLYIDYIPKSYPYTVAFTSQTISNNTAFIPRWMPLKGYYESVEKSTYTIIYDPENKPNYKSEIYLLCCS